MMLWEITVADGLHCKAKHVLKLSQCLSAQKSQGVCNFYNFLYLFLAAGNDMTLEPKHNVVKHEKLYEYRDSPQHQNHWQSERSSVLLENLGFCQVLAFYLDMYHFPQYYYRLTRPPVRASLVSGDGNVWGPDPDSRPPSSIWHLLDASQINGGAILETHRYFRSHRLCHRAEHHTTGQSCFGATKVI